MKFLAKILTSSVVVDWLTSRFMTDDHDYGHLYSADGKPYMLRFEVIAVGSKASKVLSFLTGGRYDHVRIHHILAPDADRELHNHPFNYRTFVLVNWYTEATEDGYGLRTLLQGDTFATKTEHFHRVALVASGGVVTLFCMGKDTGTWGFKVDGKFVPSKEFFRLRKIKANGVAE